MTVYLAASALFFWAVVFAARTAAVTLIDTTLWVPALLFGLLAAWSTILLIQQFI